MAEEIAEFINVTPNMQHMDRFMVAVNIRNLSLLELFYPCVASLAKVMHQRRTTLKEEQHHYIENVYYNHCLYHKRNFDSTKRTFVLMRDAEKHQMQLVTTNFTDCKTGNIYADFEFTEDDHHLIKCVNGVVLDECTHEPNND